MINANGSFTFHKPISDCRELSLLKHHGSCVAVARQRHASEYRDDMFNLHNQMNYGTNIFGLAAKRKNMLSPSHIFCIILPWVCMLLLCVSSYHCCPCILGQHGTLRNPGSLIATKAVDRRGCLICPVNDIGGGM